jgi:hypothetical protein
MPEFMQPLRHEDGLDVYQDLETGKEAYVGRARAMRRTDELTEKGRKRRGMALFDFLKRKPVAVSKPWYEIGGGGGLSQNDPIEIRITDAVTAGKVFWESFGKSPKIQALPRATAERLIGPMLGETIKSHLLEKLLGPKGHNWNSTGHRMYWDGHIQSDAIQMSDGRIQTYWFDFSGSDCIGE